MSLFRRVIVRRRNQFLKVALLTLMLVAFSSSGFMYFELAEKPDLVWGDAIWWSIVTMTTVGYGDYFPSTVGGRYVIGFPTMLFGISILGYLLSTLASFLIEERTKELKGMAQSNRTDHILLIHYPSLARVRAVITELHHDPKTAGLPVVIVDDFLEELPDELADHGVQFVRGDASKESTLARARHEDAKFAIILSQDPNDPSCDNSNLAAALTLEHLNPQVFTVAECIDPERIELLYKAGCDAVVCLTALATNLVVHELLDPGVQKVIDEATNNQVGQNIYMVDIAVADGARYRAARDAIENEGCAAMGLERGGKVMLNPDPATALVAGDRMICLSANRPGRVALPKQA